MSEERLGRIEGRLTSLEDGQKAIMRDLKALKDEVDRNNRILLKIQKDNTEIARKTEDLMEQTKDLMETVIRVSFALMNAFRGWKTIERLPASEALRALGGTAAGAGEREGSLGIPARNVKARGAHCDVIRAASVAWA
jgi:hypothetical protein